MLADLGIAIDDAYRDPDPAGFVRQLHPTLLAVLPPRYRPELANSDAWELSDRAGGAIVLSFMADLAMPNGDVLIRSDAMGSDGRPSPALPLLNTPDG